MKSRSDATYLQIPHTESRSAKCLSIAILIVIDCLILYHSFDILISTLKWNFPSIARHVNFRIIYLLPLSIVIDLNWYPSNNYPKTRFAFLGFLCGLITPIVDLADTWAPAIFKYFGMFENSASKLLLESFSESVFNCMYDIFPTALLGATLWASIYTINTMLRHLYTSAIFPVSKSFATWFKDVYRY